MTPSNGEYFTNGYTHDVYQQMVTSHDSNSDVYFTLMLPLYLVA